MAAVIDCHSRVAPHRDAPKASPLPASPADRERALADAVFAAVIALQAQLAHPDAAVVREAAGLILDFEKTRLRHGRPVTGTGEVFAATCGSGTPNPAPDGRGEEVEDLGDELPEEETEQVRAYFQTTHDGHDRRTLTPDQRAEVAHHPPNLGVIDGCGGAGSGPHPVGCADHPLPVTLACGEAGEGRKPSAPLAPPLPPERGSGRQGEGPGGEGLRSPQSASPPPPPRR